MVVNIFLIAVVLLIAAFFLWLVIRSLRSSKILVKIIGTLFSTLGTLIFGVVGVLALIGLINSNFSPVPAIIDVTVAGTPEQIARGEHIAEILCIDCHSSDGSLPLSGGRDIAEEIPLPLGSFPGYNLTPAGPIAGWSDGELFRAIRHGVDPDGKMLPVMAGTSAGFLGDEDIEAVIAFLRSQPAMGEEIRQESITMVGLIMFGAGMFPLQDQPTEVPVPSASADESYGQYMLAVTGCRDCHGANLTGGDSPLSPVGPNLVDAINRWTADEFINTIRTGVTPEGKVLSNAVMPWPTYKNMDDTELTALYSYIKTMNP